MLTNQPSLPGIDADIPAVSVVATLLVFPKCLLTSDELAAMSRWFTVADGATRHEAFALANRMQDMAERHEAQLAWLGF
jgi:hypothetical protein